MPAGKSSCPPPPEYNIFAYMTIRRSFRKSPRQPVSDKTCAWDGCHEAGEYRAPRSRDQLNVHDWYCLDHIRQFNKSWNYYKDMDETQVEQDIRRDVSWGRPTWRFGVNGGRHPRIHDPMGVYADSVGPDTTVVHNHTPEEVRALRVLDLSPPVTAEDVKTRYKTLAKSLHPDVTQGDKASEESFKRISEAYRVLRPWMNNVT